MPLAPAGTSFSIHEYLYDVGEMLSSVTDLPVKTFTFQAIGPVWPLRILQGTTDPLPKTTIWEIPTSFAFSGGRALEGSDLLLTAMPPFRYDVAATVPAAVVPRRLFGSSALRPRRTPPSRCRRAVFSMKVAASSTCA